MCTEYEVATPTIPPASQGMDAVEGRDVLTNWVER